MMAIDIILCSDWRQGHNTARFDWKWKQISVDVYETSEGHRAHIVTRAEQLRGLHHGTILHKAYGWRYLPQDELILVMQMVNAGRFIIGKVIE